MVRWSDVSAGALAAPRVLLRLQLWLEVLRRALFSTVFVGHAFAAFMLYMAGRTLYGGLAAMPGGSAMAVLFALVGGSLLLALAGVLLLPYAYWVFNPPAARMLQRYLDLPPPLEDEPPFSAHLAWVLPVLAAIVVALGLAALALNYRQLSPFPQLAGMALVVLALMKMFARSALSAFYDRDDTERFLAATRRQRLLVWLPVVLAVGWLLQVVLALLDFRIVAWWLAAPGGAQALFLAVLAILAQLLVYALVATVFAGALLLACGRVPAGGVGGPRTLGLHSETVPYTPPRRRGSVAAPAPAAPMSGGSRLALGGALAVALVAGGLYLGRIPLADWYLSGDRGYGEARAKLVARSWMDWTRPEHRLFAGYVQAGCEGRVDRMRWLRRLGVTRDGADELALTCAACEGQRAVVDWVLGTQPALKLSGERMRWPGQRRLRDALACAADRNDLAVAQALLQRGAPPQVGGADSAVQLAAAGLHWDMVALLLQADVRAGSGALFAALEAARAKGPQLPAELLPRMIGAGLPVGGRDAAGRTAYHWAAMHHDLPLARALLARAAQPGQAGPLDADQQGAQPWMHVLHKAEREGRPLEADSAELLRLLLPPQVNGNEAPVPRRDDLRNALPAGWSARVLALNDPAVRVALGSALDIGQLPPDPATWWKFSSPQSAEAFVRTATLTQLMRAENPDAPPGLEPRRLSAALAEAGLEPLALEVRLAVEGKRR